MTYHSTKDVLLDLEKHNQLIRIKTEVDPNIEMAAIHLRINEIKGPAIWFENVKGTPFSCASNIFGTYERTKFIFRDTFEKAEWLIKVFKNPFEAIQHPFKTIKHLPIAAKVLPRKSSSNILNHTCNISDLPLIKHWPDDGGAFVTLPQVYSENVLKPGIWNSNLGMYRIQLTGNDYVLNKEIGLHYQLHRGIGVHQQLAIQHNKPFRVSIIVGGPPAHSLAAIMPLPEGMSELMFAGLLGNKRYRYTYVNNQFVSSDADFVITGTVIPSVLKPEGPFGDHLGYYSLRHNYPVLKVEKVYHRKNAIWPFTVVGRPPQEDSIFGEVIHELTGWAAQKEIPGLKDLYAVDEAGVHPLLLATGSERYTPYLNDPTPAEIITIGNHILGTGQLSLLKYLFITAEYQTKVPSCHDIAGFFQYVLERINLQRDVHFYTHTSLDTLDYSGMGFNRGSKVMLCAYGPKQRELSTEFNSQYNITTFKNPKVVIPGILILQGNAFKDYLSTKKEIQNFETELKEKNIELNGFPMIVITDDSDFTAAHINNFLWITFIKSNPSHDIYGLNEYVEHHHFGMSNIIIDARTKPHHAPILEKDQNVEKKIDKLFSKGGEIYEWLHKNK